MAEEKVAEGHLDRTDLEGELVISHSNLIYWWPVWLAGLIMALITFFDNDRAAVFSNDARLKVEQRAGDNGRTVTVYEVTEPRPNPILQRAAEHATNHPAEAPFYMRMSHRPWIGPVFLAVLLLVLFITNVPLRGLWSLVVVIVLIAAVIIISLAGWWEDIFRVLGGLHIYMNMAGYLFTALAILVLWLIVNFAYDRRRYLVFTAGQMRVRLEIGEGEDTFDTRNMVIKKAPLDFFRHRILGLWFLGLGAGDLEIHTSGARTETIYVPNVWRIDHVLMRMQEMQRDIPIVQG
jgi:hypothetical protein